MADITEIIEESAVQLEIVETGGGQLEITGGESSIIEVVETSVNLDDLDIATQTNTVVVESISDNTTVDIKIDDPTIIETTITSNVVEINEISVIQSGSIFNITNVTASGGEDWDGTRDGDASITGSLVVSNTLFTDVLSASIAQFTGDGINNILIISSGSNTPITVNSEGLIMFDQFTYTPPPVEGGFLYSGSEFFIGLVDP
tara:strand:- start:670 stop:1278 length:609 start_codon:yes stop_codon:yes gene_type:complete